MGTPGDQNLQVADQKKRVHKAVACHHFRFVQVANPVAVAHEGCTLLLSPFCNVSFLLLRPMSADDDDPGLPVPKAYRTQDQYTAMVSKNTLKKNSPFVLQVLPYCGMLCPLTLTFPGNSRSFLFVSLVQPSEPKGLYVAGWVHRVNKQKKQVQLCDDQEFMPREYEIKNGKVANQAFLNVCDCAFGNACYILVLFSSTLRCFVRSFHFSLKMLAVTGCFQVVSRGGCTLEAVAFRRVIQWLHISLFV